MVISKVKSIDAFKITGYKDAQSMLLKSKFSRLINSYLKFEKRKEDNLLARVENRLLKKGEAVIHIIKVIKKKVFNGNA